MERNCGGVGSPDAYVDPEDRTLVIAPEDVFVPPGVEGKIVDKIKAIRLLRELVT
jgi:hypothetical protein